MRRVAAVAMVVALMAWLLPAPCMGLCAAAAASHGKGCCASTHETTRETAHGTCCAPGSASALPVADKSDVARGDVFAGSAQLFAAKWTAEFHLADRAAARGAARPRPLTVLRT